ncbi:leucine-rich_repeat domain-containing protein [Hexamita inflata]|uniref:Leucine-rich repeat domain-containing protein n=1 Tax=Hexamita inflata TaxID=28002 RepID=A0AA86NSA7_9EUKA|nr:leucine-rich repeat domain-containing protein [Hexamita inflata]
MQMDYYALGYVRDIPEDLCEQIQDQKLKIDPYYDDLQNIEFINNFEIEELVIDSCINIIPRLNNPRIKKIIFDNCRINRLSELQLPNLEIVQIQEYSQFQDANNLIVSLGQFKKLKELMLQCYSGVDLKLIPKLQFTKLQLVECNLKNIELLTKFTQLTNLSLAENPHIDINPLSQMIQLTELNLSCCFLKNVEPLKPLINLKDLNLACNVNLNIYPLQYLKQLTILDLQRCSLIDLTYLKPLINLKQLDISTNNIVYLEPLKELKCIVKLFAFDNKILDKLVLSSHTSYSIIYLGEPKREEIAFANKLRDINAQITSLKNIQTLHSNLKQQMISEFQKVDNCQQHILYNQSQFVGKIASLFQQLGCQDFQ